MESFLSTLLNLAVLTFAITSMLSVGFGHTIEEIITPLRHPRGVIRALLSNFVLVPLLVFGVARLLSLDRPLEIGLMLISMAAGAPFLIKLTEHAEHDVGLSATLLVLLLPTTVLYLPLVCTALGVRRQGERNIDCDAAVADNAPSAGHRSVRQGALSGVGGNSAARHGRTSSIALVALVVATFLLNFRGILNLFGTGAILGVFLVIAGAFLIGYALGGPDPEIRGVLGLGTGQRNISAATVIATQGFDDARILVMVVISSLVGLALLFPAARILRHRLARHTAAEIGSDIRNEI